jgi:hypothetical protein
MLPVDDKKRRFARPKAELDARESSVEGRAKRYAKSLGYWVRKFKSPGMSSVPDDVFKHPHGPVVFIEFKAFGKPATELQKNEHEEMRSAGLIVYVVDNFEDAKAILDRHSL